MLQRGEDREAGKSGRLGCLFHRDGFADLTRGERRVPVYGAVSRHVGVLAADPHQVELELDSDRGGEGLRQLQAELGEPLLDPSHRPGTLALAWMSAVTLP